MTDDELMTGALHVYTEGTNGSPMSNRYGRQQGWLVTFQP